VRNKLIFLILIFTIGYLSTFSQAGVSLIALKNNEIKKAKYLIDSLTEMQLYDKDAEVWYVNGLIYEIIYFSKDSLTRLLTKSPLLMAAESYLKVSQNTPITKYNKLANKKLDSAVTKSLFTEGTKLEKEKKIEDAVSHLGLYSKIKPEDTSGLIRLAMAGEKAKKNSLAKDSYLKLLGLKYKTKPVYKSLIIILKEENSNDEAQKYLVEARKVFPNDEDWVKLDILLAFGSQKDLLALLKLDSATIAFPNNKKIYLFNKGVYYDSKDSITRAISYYEQAIATDANYYEPNYNLGGIYYRRSKDIYTEINEMPYVAYQKIGREKAEQGHTIARKAMPYFEKCYQVRPEENVKELLTDIYKNLGLNSKLRALERKMTKN